MSELSGSSLSALMIQGQQLKALLEQGEFAEAERVATLYLQAIEDLFAPFTQQHLPNSDQQQLLLQLHDIHAWVRDEKQQAEKQLRQLSQASRASDLYKLSTGEP